VDEEKNELQELADAAPGSPVPVSQGIAAIALSMAMKYHDMTLVKDGQLYQQYKLEGRNITTIDLADVFDTAIQIELHLLQANERIARLLVDALEVVIEEDEAQEEPDV
jgi:hypothetical protein